MTDYAAEEEDTDDFAFNVGDVVTIQGAPEKQYGISWRGKVVDRWYDEEACNYTPWWYEVTAVDEAPHYRTKYEKIIIHEGEVIV